MTSFVREILSAGGMLGEKEDLATKTNRLKKQMEERKAEMRKEMEGKYVGFLSSFNDTSSLVSQLEAAVEEVEALRSTINHHLKPEMAEGRREMMELLKQLEELSAAVEVANRIKKVYEDMEQTNNLLDEKKYLQASIKLKEVDLVINSENQNLESCDEDQLKAFEAARSEFIAAQGKINYILGKEWDSVFRLEEETAGRDIPQKVRLTFEVIDGQQQQDGGQHQHLSRLIQAMKMVDMLSYRLSRFAQKLLHCILEPLIERRMRLTICEQSISLELIDDEKSMPEKVFQDLTQIFEILYQVLNVAIEGDAGEKPTMLLAQIGEYCADKFVRCLIKNCLASAVPSKKEELAKFEVVMEKAVALQKMLIDVGFLHENNSEIADYANNVDETFATKRVASILSDARELMKDDLHHTKSVEETQPLADKNFESLVKDKLGKTVRVRTIPELEDLNLPDGFSFNDCIFRFPKCQISRHVSKVLSLVHATLEEACCSNALLAARLVNAARVIFELYRDVLPIYHRDALLQFPQHSALAFTNCMYLAHQCSILGYEYKDRLPSPLDEQFLTFADMIVKVRTVGIELFQDQLRRQRDEIDILLKESGFSQLQGEAQLHPKTEKSLKQILHQLSRLRNVWQVVLPSHVYSRSIGVLLNFVVGELIQRVVKLEDIAADAAIQLSTLFSLVEEKAPEVFLIDGDSSSSKHDVVRCVPLWQKFKELILVLNSGLREIEDRWTNGKGPLAVEFTVDEMKQLIRALFQNTDRRATVLAKIKYEA